MRCPRCNLPSVVDSAFCNACGAAIPQSYTPSHLTADLLTSPATVEGERKQVTVLFCDLVGSTSLAERLGAERMHAILDAFFAISVAHVHRYEGTINQFLGDGFMALFGAPVAYEDHARRAALAALAIQHDIERQRFDVGGLGDEALAIRMGLNSGLVVVGRIGDHLRMDYAAVGDTTNLAARMQQLAPPGAAYVAGATRRLIDQYVETVAVGERRVKGRKDTIQVYRLVGPRRHDEPARRAHQPVRSPLVGREEELNRLAQSIERLQHGQGAIVAVLGEAGLGKSRLIAELAATSGPRVRWLEGRALSFGSHASYSPFLEILRTTAGIGDDASDAEAAGGLENLVRRLFPGDVADILPYLATLLALPVTGDLQHRVTHLDGHATGLQVFRSVLLLFERLARERPLVLVFEDAHWADRSSLTLLEHLLPLVASVPLVIVVVARPERDTPAAHFLVTARKRAADRYVEIVLPPLSESSSLALLNNVLAGDGTSLRLQQAAIARAEGNPLFLEEIIRSVAADELLRWNAAEGRWRLTREIEQVKLPDTLHDVITARIDRLDAQTKQLLKVASVIGRRFHRRVLLAVSDAEPQLDAYLETLQGLELVREKRRVPELEYFFIHAIVQEATYGTILESRRRELHQRVGECIERLFEDRLEDFYSVLAYHYARAEAWQKAQEYLFKAGDQAGRIAADAEALAHYQNAIEAYEKAFGDKWDPVQRSTLERKMGEALFRLGSHEEALAYVIAAKARLHAPLTALPKSAGGIRLAIGLEVARRIRRHLLPGPRLWRRLPPVEPVVLEEIARAGEVTGWIDYFLNPERFLLQALTGLSYFERHPYAIGLIYNHMSIGLICDVVPLFRLAEGHHRQALAIATESGQPIALGHAHLGIGIHAHSLGQLQAALVAYRTSATIFRGIGHIRGWGGATMMQAWVHEDLGEFERALAQADSVNSVGAESSDPQVRVWGLQRRAVSLRYMGRLESAINDLEASIELSKRIPDYAAVAQGVAVLGLCYLDRGDLASARRFVDEANRIRAERKLRGMWVAHAVTAAAAVAVAELPVGGNSRALRKRAERACREAQKHGHAASHRRAAALRLWGELRWCEGNRGAAERCWRRAEAAAEAAGARYELALAKARIGGCLYNRDDLERSAVLFEESGAAPDLARVQQLLRLTAT